jgi:cold shock CspA family protein
MTGQGTIIYLLPQGMGGFIEPDMKGGDIFFSGAILSGSVVEQLHVGDRVQYCTADDARCKAVDAIAVDLLPT